MQVKIASFSVDSGLPPVLTTTPWVAMMLAARKENRTTLGDGRKSPGHLDIERWCL